MVLKVRDLSVGRGGLPVLEGLGFGLDAGAALILRGPNGSGKTTLLRTLAGLTPPLSGEVLIDPDQIAYAGHADGLKVQLTVGENLRFWARAFGQTDITPALDAFDLHRLETRRVAELSAGQKRRTGLARMLVTGRKLWLMDEPTVSLDAENTARFAASVTRHLGEGGAAILATHIDLGLTAQTLAQTLDVGTFRATRTRQTDADPFAWEDGA